MSMVVFRREHHCGASLGRLRTGKCAHDDVVQASTGFPLPIFEAPHGGRCGFREILVSPGIGPLDGAPARQIGKLTSPIQDLPSFFWRERPDHAD
jgi:hypothetical protein